MKRLPKTIFIDSPAMNERIANPIKIAGRAKSETGAIIATLLDKNGMTIETARVSVRKNELTPFEIEIKYKRPNTDLGLIKQGLRERSAHN